MALITSDLLGGGPSSPARTWTVESRAAKQAAKAAKSRRSAAAGRTTRGDYGHLMLGERILPQSEVIRAILLEYKYSPCCGVPAPASAIGSPSSRAELARPAERRTRVGL